MCPHSLNRVKTSKELDKLRFLCDKIEGVVRYSNNKMDVFTITVPVKTSTELDKLKFLCEKLGVV